jgi:hypothetical protein
MMAPRVPDPIAAEAGSSVCRRIVAWVIVLAVALVHILRAGSHLSDSWRRLYAGYASDLLLPMAMYFVLALNRRNSGRLRDWKLRAVMVFAAASWPRLEPLSSAAPRHPW